MLDIVLRYRAKPEDEIARGSVQTIGTHRSVHVATAIRFVKSFSTMTHVQNMCLSLQTRAAKKNTKKNWKKKTERDTLTLHVHLSTI